MISFWLFKKITRNCSSSRPPIEARQYSTRLSRDLIGWRLRASDFRACSDGLHQADDNGGVLLDPRNLHQGLGAGVQDLGEGAEMLDYPLGQGLDVGVGDGKGQEQVQELIVLQGPGASREEALPEAGAVPVVMWLYRLFRHISSLFTPLRRQLQPGKPCPAALGARPGYHGLYPVAKSYFSPPSP